MIAKDCFLSGEFFADLQLSDDQPNFFPCGFAYEQEFFDSSFERKESLETRVSRCDSENDTMTGNPSRFDSPTRIMLLRSEDEPRIEEQDSRCLPFPFSDCLSVSSDMKECKEIRLKKIKKPTLGKTCAYKKDPTEAVRKELFKQARKLKEHWTLPWVVAPSPFKKLCVVRSCEEEEMVSWEAEKSG